MDLMNNTVSYAQNKEDIILDALLYDIERGFYVDVGAAHPSEHSVTKRFYDLGWSGINVEPNRRLFNLLAQQRKRDINLNMGVSEDAGELVLRQYKGNAYGLSTFADEVKSDYAKDAAKQITQEYDDVKVPVLPLSDIFKQHLKDGDPIHFLKVDVEGYEYEVLNSNDWKTYRPQVLCIEANHVKKDWRSLLEKHKYQKAFFDGLNEYYVASEHQKRIAVFLESTFLEKMVGAAPVSPQVSDKLRTATVLESRNTRLEKEVAELRQELVDAKRLPGIVNSFEIMVGATHRFVNKNLARLKKRSFTGAARNVSDANLEQLSSNTSAKQIIASIHAHDVQQVRLKSRRRWRWYLPYKALLWTSDTTKRLVAFGLKVARKIKRTVLS